MINTNHRRFLCSFGLLLSVLINLSCAKEQLVNYYLIKGSHTTTVELNTIIDLQNDLMKVLPNKVKIISENQSLPATGIFYIIGTKKSNGSITELIQKSKIKFSSERPESGEGIWTKTNLINNQETIIIAGSDVQGLQRAVYNYSRSVLKIDPLSYWTGKISKKLPASQVFNFDTRIITAPKVPIRCYFENDVDELANYRGQLLKYDWESYTEMINSLVRLGYNAIEFFDMLGRPEFFLRPEYKGLHPGYKVDLEYLEKMMDYAHDKGMKIQINFALGYQIHPFPLEKSDCWSTYKNDWIEAWRYYLEETPLAKTDIFALRPRNQVWDWEYISSCGEDKIEVFNEIYEVFGKLVDDHNPNAQKVLVCYSDGMEMYNQGLRPPEDWIIAWSDDGFGKFKSLPKTTDHYDFGTYMHAGFWSNHTVHDPYPNVVENKMNMMFNDFSATKYCLVNGQNFRPFLLNLEAYSEVSTNPETFIGEQFYKDWTTRYFGNEASPFAIIAMKELHKTQFGRVGYVQNLWEIREAIAYLSNTPIERHGKEPIPYAYNKVETDYEDLKQRMTTISVAASAAEKGAQKVVSADAVFYHDYITLPIQIYQDLLVFEHRLHQICKLKKAYEEHHNTAQIKEALQLLKVAKKDLEMVHQRRLQGDRNPKWKGWYDPKIRRPNNGFPTQTMLQSINNNLNRIAKQDNGA